MRIAALAVALAVALPLAACGDEEDGGRVAEGTGYELTVPDGWEDRSEEGEDVEVEGFSPDVLLTGERDEGFTSNVNVVITSGTGGGIDAQVRAEREALESGRLPGSEEPNPAQDLTPVERTTLDGRTARAHEFGLTRGDDTVRLRQVFARYDGSGYTVTLTTAPDRFDEDREAFESMIESWRWR